MKPTRAVVIQVEILNNHYSVSGAGKDAHGLRHEMESNNFLSELVYLTSHSETPVLCSGSCCKIKKLNVKTVYGKCFFVYI